MFSSLVGYETPLNNRKPGSLAYSILLSNTLFGKEISYLTEDQLQNCTFISGNVAFNTKGYALQGTTTVEKKKADCKQEEMKELVETGKSYFNELRRAIDFSKILQLTFQVDSLKFSSTWLSCKHYAESLITTEEDYRITDTTVCFVSDQTSSEWLDDPCCNSGILWKSCCLPRAKNISTEISVEPDMNRINGECENGDCVSSYISDLIELDANQFQCATFKSEEYPKLVDKSQQFYIDCRNKFNIDNIVLGLAICHSDVECRFGGFSNKCNFVTSRCIASRELELATLRCIVDGMDLYTQSYFKDTLDLPGKNKKDSEFFESFVDHFTVKDCRNNLGK
jgi:hypothetical protein